MSRLVSCKCGAQVRLPAQSENRRFRCPKCRTGIALTVNAKVLLSAPMNPGITGVTCPICQSPIATDESAVTCPGCDQVHHRECWAEVGGCGTYGCTQVPSLGKDPAATQPPLSAWGDNKSCPACGETIKAIAVKCRYCDTKFGTVDPLSLHDLHSRVRKDKSLKTLRATVVTLFVLSLIGCLAPLIAIVSMCVVLPKRKELAREGPFYLTLGYSSVALSVVYSVLMLLFALF